MISQNKTGMSARRLILEDENVGSRLEPSLSTSRKAILPNKANSSVSSRNRDTSTAVIVYSCRLKNEGLVNVRRDGTFLWYSANTDALGDLLTFLYSECCTRNRAIKPQTIIHVSK